MLSSPIDTDEREGAWANFFFYPVAVIGRKDPLAYQYQYRESIDYSSKESLLSRVEEKTLEREIFAQALTRGNPGSRGKGWVAG